MQLPYTTERILSGKISYLIEYAAPYMSGYHRIVVAKAYHITSGLSLQDLRKGETAQTVLILHDQ